MDSDRGGWPSFFNSLKHNLHKLRSDILPPQNILETFIIVPEEMAIPFRLIMPSRSSGSDPGMHLWELNQIMTEDPLGYSANFHMQDQESPDKINIHGLAVRNSILNRINGLLKKKSIHLSGVYFPHELWQELEDSLPEECDGSVLLYKSGSACLVYRAGNGSRQEFQRYPLPQEAAEDNGNLRKSLHLIAENISYITQSGKPGDEMRSMIFEGNFGNDELNLMEELLGISPQIIDPDELGEELNPEDRWEFLPALVAGKKSAELYMQKLNL